MRGGKPMRGSYGQNGNFRGRGGGNPSGRGGYQNFRGCANNNGTGLNYASNGQNG